MATTGLWRADLVREDADALAARATDPRAARLVCAGAEVAVEGGALVRRPLGDAPADTLIFLGEEAGPGGAPLFAPLPLADELVDAADRRALRDLARLADPEAQLAATVRTLRHWHAASRHCGRCGGQTRASRAGWARTCEECGDIGFPRVDPVVIMLPIHRGRDRERALVARQPRFPAGLMSALAGFVEPGESVELAVAREVLEEAGLRVTATRYIASQPWPFPASLMIGCMAEVADDQVTLDETELEAARWVSKAEALAALRGDADAAFTAPPPLAIARTLLMHWASDEA